MQQRLVMDASYMLQLQGIRHRENQDFDHIEKEKSTPLTMFHGQSIRQLAGTGIP